MVRAFDLFCGGGGSSHGAERAGATIVGGIDYWNIATTTFSDNFPSAKTFTDRIENVPTSLVATGVGGIDLLLASPECTNHSCARGARPKEAGSRETAFEVLRFASAFNPRWIVIENVIHMRPWDGYRELTERLRQLGYHVAEHVIDAADFGVPQRRKRLFLLCDREMSAPRRLSKRRGPKLAARTILDKAGSWHSTLLDNGRRAVATLERAKRGIGGVGPGTSFIMVYYGTDGSGGWQSLDTPLRTITTLDRFALVEPSDAGYTIRMLQVPELARAMGFMSTYKLVRGSRRDKIRILGNGVCPPVMEAVVQELCGSSLNFRTARKSDHDQVIGAAT